jgi:hypothetical protein
MGVLFSDRIRCSARVLATAVLMGLSSGAMPALAGWLFSGRPVFAAEGEDNRRGRPDSGSHKAQRDKRRREEIEATREVVRRVARAARVNSMTLPNARRRGDELTKLYVQQAAHEAAKFPKDLGPRALLTGIGIAIDDSDVLRKNPLTRDFFNAVETPQEREERLKLLDSPTMLDRRDLAQHFVVSAFLTAELGSRAADAAGMAKELMDAQSGSGFSFADLAADQAGIIFAERVLSGELLIRRVALTFPVSEFMPSIAGLPEGLKYEEFQREYMADGSRKYNDLRSEIRKRILALPPYQATRQQPR